MRSLLGQVRGLLLLLLLLLASGVFVAIMLVFMAFVALATRRYRHTTTRDRRHRRLSRKLVVIHIDDNGPYLRQAEITIAMAGLVNELYFFGRARRRRSSYVRQGTSPPYPSNEVKFRPFERRSPLDPTPGA